MLFALLVVMQVAAEPVATCRVAGDSQQRAWALERRDASSWQIAFTSPALDKPRVILPLPNASPAITAAGIHLSYKSANGGRTVEWRITNGASTLDLHVNHGLEVNVEADLDPAVDVMNTDGPLTVACSTAVLRGFDEGSTAVLRGFDEGSTAVLRGFDEGSTAVLRGFDEGSTAVLRGFDGRADEWVVAVGVARSVNLFESTSGRGFAVQTIGWGRELTRELGPGAARGRFAWAFEATPLFAQFSPSSIYGLGFAPVVWRWNFVPQPRWSAFAELSMGGLWSTKEIPDGTSRVNFTAHWGAGLRLRPRGSHALLLGYRFQHFSNGNQLGDNPGVNSHVLLVGWSHRS